MANKKDAEKTDQAKPGESSAVVPGAPVKTGSPTKDITQVRETIYDVSINAADVGYIDDIEIDIAFKTKARMLKQLGAEQPLGLRLRGIVIMIKGKFRQVGAAQVGQFFPWSDSTPIALSPLAMGGDLYDCAGGRTAPAGHGRRREPGLRVRQSGHRHRPQTQGRRQR